MRPNLRWSSSDGGREEEEVIETEVPEDIELQEDEGSDEQTDDSNGRGGRGLEDPNKEVFDVERAGRDLTVEDLRIVWLPRLRLL